MENLIGSEKQIEWATKIIERVTTQINTAITTCDFSEKNLKKVEEIKEELTNNQSSFWINTFKTDNEMFEYLNNKGIAGIKIAREINKLNGED